MSLDELQTISNQVEQCNHFRTARSTVPTGDCKINIAKPQAGRV